MKIRLWTMILVGCLFGGTAAASVQFRAVLDGGQVSPTSVDTVARGRATFSFNAHFARMAFRLKLRKASGIIAAQLHCAPPGAEGPLVADLLGPVIGGWNGGLDISASLTAANLLQTANCAAAIGKPIADLADLAGAMAESQIYVEVPSAAYPDGEIRGQTEPLSATPVTVPPDSGPTVAPPATSTVVRKTHTGLSSVSTAAVYSSVVLIAPAQRATLPTYFNPPCPSTLNPQCSPTSFNPPCPSTFGALCAANPTLPLGAGSFSGQRQ